MALNYSWQAALHPGRSDDFFMRDHPGEFREDAGGFNPVNAWWLSEISRLIYKRDRTEGVAASRSRNDYLQRVGLVERRFFDAPNIQAALVETAVPGRRPFAVLVFRGTAGRLSNWRFNLDMAASDWPGGGRIHRGFGHLIMQIWPSVGAALAHVDAPLYYTGHSLGGAMATLAASLHAPHAVYTFGAPRVGDRAFARSLGAVRIFNVVNPHDVVTQLPPASPGFRFAHAGSTITNAAPASVRRPMGQAPAFLAGHAPLNYSGQLPVAFNN